MNDGSDSKSITHDKLIRKDFGKNAVKSVIILAGKNQGFETENLVAKADAI